ncbi:hypothetical protein A6P39_011235 [Streptomyces sp. FXJ1.172]|uniref:hypothetical protein n=1 Tax=Streptomyces sp. FXJ1.172 TaxID=710705 RepID=UPI0007D01855|nr:hypothetical protein [Streptomyces sp. FXJ1.172]WEO94535.1 hypothetical protein A6P39_011235 [Streptomyces sp. FXJ1.172]
MSGTASRLGRAAVLAAALLGAGAVPAAANDSLITVIDNSHADSWLEVDRTANVQTGRGTAGSDHDGSAVDAIEALVGAAHGHREVWDG